MIDFIVGVLTGFAGGVNIIIVLVRWLNARSGHELLEENKRLRNKLGETERKAGKREKRNKHFR